MSEETQSVWDVIEPFKRVPTGDFISLRADGVIRLYHSDTFEVVDAARLSPAQIKEWLNRKPFDQAVEDKFRGVDGRGVSDKDMFSPPEAIRIKRPSEEFFQKHREERRRLIEERERNPVKSDPNAVCGRVRSNYNLDPI